MKFTNAVVKDLISLIKIANTLINGFIKDNKLLEVFYKAAKFHEKKKIDFDKSRACI